MNKPIQTTGPRESTSPAGDNSTAIYTVSQIARGRGVSRQAVSVGIEKTEPTGFVDVQGKPIAAWGLQALAIDWQLEITRRGVRKNFENAESFLASMPLTPWKAPSPWDEISKREQDKAIQLQKALARALEMRNNPETAAAIIEQTGLEDFKREFNYAISPRHWRRLLARTIDRDGAEENWLRCEIYVDERAFALPKVAREAVRSAHEHRSLDSIITSLENRQAPTPTDRQCLWDAVFRHYEEQTDALTDSPDGNRKRRLFKTSILAYIFAAFPERTLCTTYASLKRRFDEKLVQWRSGGRNPQALVDTRGEESGRSGRSLCASCRPLVMGGAVDLDGDLSQAWRRLQLAGKLCQDCANIGSYDVRRAKSAVPKSVRRDVTPDILAALPYRRGPKHARLMSPYVRRNWNDIGPGDFAECDDMTPNHVTHGMVQVLAWRTDDSGAPYLGRMEALFQIDRRTDYPWAYIVILGDPATCLSPQRKASYSSVHCRLLFLRAHDQLGLPHEGGGYVLENSVWASRLIDGPKLQHWNCSSWQATEMGLRDPRIGLSVHHTIPGNPRSKVIERVFLAIQNRMRCAPGFVGFNERDDKREVLADFINRVKAGKEHPGNEVPQISDFCKLLDSTLMEYANEAQNGERLPGVSPMEAFHNGIGGRPGIKERPLRQLGDDARFLLSSHERVLPVTQQGISFKIGGRPFVFWGPELEPFQHREIIARFNFEQPELLTCQGPDGTPFTVKARILPSTTATKEQLAETARDRANWMRPGKVHFDNLPHPFRANIVRDSGQTEKTKELGRFHNEEVAKFKEEKAEAGKSTKRARDKITEAGFDPDRLRPKDPVQAAAAAERFKQRFDALRAKEAQEHTQEASNE